MGLVALPAIVIRLAKPRCSENQAFGGIEGGFFRARQSISYRGVKAGDYLGESGFATAIADDEEDEFTRAKSQIDGAEHKMTIVIVQRTIRFELIEKPEPLLPEGKRYQA